MFVGIEDMFVGRDRPDHAFLIHATSQKVNAGVVRPGTVFNETGAGEAVPDDLAAWVEARTDLRISSSTPVTLGAVQGTLIEATVAVLRNSSALSGAKGRCASFGSPSEQVHPIPYRSRSSLVPETSMLSG